MLRQSRKIQFIILLTLVCLVGVTTIAYAALSTTLNINGTAQVMDASWDVHFENIQVNPGSIPIDPKITDNDKITFVADLTTPGQYYRFTVDIVNSGSIDAMIETIITNPKLTDAQKKYLRYEVEYSNGNSINERQLLTSNETRTISVLVSYRNDIPVNELPTTEENLNIEIRVVYVQATSIGIQIPQKEDNLVRFVSGDLNTIGSEICIGEECFYLTKNDGYKATLLAKYNLYVGGKVVNGQWTSYGEEATGIQNSTMIGYQKDLSTYHGIVKFSENNYWNENGILKTIYENSQPPYVYDQNSTLYTYVENYKNYLENTGIKIVSARLISVEELFELGCYWPSCGNTYDWVYSTAYWTGSLRENGFIYRVDTDADVNSYVHDVLKDWGVRPVIEIPLTEF